MDTTPTYAATMVQTIDKAVENLLGNHLARYEIVAKKYHKIKAMYYLSLGLDQTKVPALGFEAYITADLRSELEKLWDWSKVFMEFPGIGKDKIDLFIEDNDVSAYIENKMYYSPSDDYRDDFEKVLSLVDLEGFIAHSVGYLLHFQLYENRNYPAHYLYEAFRNELEPSKWWAEVKCIGDKDKKHFVRLAFAKKE